MIYKELQQIQKVYKGSLIGKTLYKGAQRLWRAVSLIQAFISRVNLDGGTYYENGAAANIDETASLVLTPSAVKPGKLYSILPEDGAGDFIVERNSTATRVNPQGLIEVVPANVPRIDRSTGEPMLLVEGPTTNLVLHSSAIDHIWWLKTECAIGINAAVAPDGTITADKYIKQGSAAVLWKNGAGIGALNPNKKYTFSCWYKSDNPGITQIGVYGVSGFVRKSIDVSSQWKKYEVTEFPEANGNLNIYIIDERSTAFNSLNEVYIWGAQLEEGSKGTSYIPTNGSTVTRLSDRINTNNNLPNKNVFSGIFDINTDFQNIENNRYYFRFYSELTNSYFTAYSLPNRTIYLRAEGLNGNVVSSHYGSPANGRHKLGFSIENGVLKLALDGVALIGSQNNLVDLSSLSKLCFGGYHASASSLTGVGRYKIFKIYPTALTDQQLIDLTTL